MTAEEIIIALIRIAGSLPVLRWPLAGALLAIAVDLSDLAMMDALHLGGVRDYQALDKALDLVYMTTFLVVALRWRARSSEPRVEGAFEGRGLERRVAIALWLYRIAGVVAFEVTARREVLLLFPNVFEFWFVLIATRDRFWPRHALTPRRALRWLLPLALAKEAQEYVLHYARWLDEYTFFEFWRLAWAAVWHPLASM